ncbi:MAG: hypothetical protein ACFFDN_36100 [Candidatus Hodarchaeota archaeon]
MLSILIDNNTLTGFKNYLGKKGVNYFYVSSFAQFIEALVLADKIFVDKMSFNISEIADFIEFLNPKLKKIVFGLEISDKIRGNAVSYAQDIERKLNFEYKEEYDDMHLLRAYFYRYLSIKYDLPYFPHIKRTFFLSLLEGLKENIAEYRKAFRIYENLRYQAYSDLLKKELINYEYKSLPYPQVFYYLVDKANNILELIEIAIDLRKSKNAIAYRKWCSELYEANKNYNHLKQDKLFKEVEKYFLKICSYQKSKDDIRWQISFPFSITLTNIPFFKNKHHLLFLKQIIKSTNYKCIEEKLKGIFNI